MGARRAYTKTVPGAQHVRVVANMLTVATQTPLPACGRGVWVETDYAM